MHLAGPGGRGEEVVMPKQRKRGTRRIVGYVVSHSGKRGGPYEANGRTGTSTTEEWAITRWRDKHIADSWLPEIRAIHQHARVLPVVRYELDREEERLRDAVVEAAIEVERVSHMAALFRADFDDEVKADLRLESATRALRAHLEKKG